jgi:hypothetical protein
VFGPESNDLVLQLRKRGIDKVLLGVGHYSPEDAPQEVTRIVSEFITRTDKLFDVTRLPAGSAPVLRVLAESRRLRRDSFRVLIWLHGQSLFCHESANEA